MRQQVSECHSLLVRPLKFLDVPLDRSVEIHLAASDSCIIAVVNPTTFVSDAMSQSVLSSGRGDGAQSSDPAPCSASTESRFPTTAIAPGRHCPL
jgi:hypothetical protein